MQIAVMLDQQGETSSFELEGEVVIYEKTCVGWEESRRMHHDIQGLTNAQGLRERLYYLGKWLGSCKILVVKRIRGIHYLALESSQVSLLEIQGKPSEFLNAINECSQHQRNKQSSISIEYTAIFEQRQGNFYIDLRPVMEGKTSYTSKQILLPFFEKSKFDTLEILCEHVPRWFEKELSFYKLSFRTEEFKNCVKVFVTHT